jgi:hypothetical protein
MSPTTKKEKGVPYEREKKGNKDVSVYDAYYSTLAFHIWLSGKHFF